MVALIGGVFDHGQQIRERLRTGPELASGSDASPAPACWTLARIGAAFPFLANWSLSGIWKVLQAAGVKLRRGRRQQYSPDPAYQQKVDHLLAVLAEVAAAPRSKVALFVDEMGFFRWPEPSRDWCEKAPAPIPLADRKHSSHGQWRLIGALHAISGQVLILDNYIVGRKQIAAFLEQIDQCFPDACKIYIIWDNWSIHQHEEVKMQLARLPRLEVVRLPTYAPWLNPIEKMWRKFRQEVLYLHRFADCWETFRQRIRAYFAQFVAGSPDVLRYVGLTGDGMLATALRGP